MVGARGRQAKQVSAAFVSATDKPTLREFVAIHSAAAPAECTDEHASYEGLEEHRHETGQHKAGEYARGSVQTNGIESFWALLKRSHHGTYPKVSGQRLSQCLRESTNRLNQQNRETHCQTEALADGLVGKRLMYPELQKAKQEA